MFNKFTFNGSYVSFQLTEENEALIKQNEEKSTSQNLGEKTDPNLARTLREGR